MGGVERRQRVLEFFSVYLISMVDECRLVSGKGRKIMKKYIVCLKFCEKTPIICLL